MRIKTSPMTELRRAEASDVDSIAAIWHDGWIDGHLGHVPGDLVAHRTPAEFRRRTIARLPRTSVAADGAGGVVGFVVVVDDEVEQLYVLARARGTDVAARLIAHAELTIAEHHTEAWLAVVEGNLRARRFYERCGWRDTGTIDNLAETSDGTMIVRALRYAKNVRGRIEAVR